MKIYEIAIGLMIFSLMVGVYNDLGVFNSKPYDPGMANVSISEIENLNKPGTDGNIISTAVNDIMGIPSFIFKIMGMAWKLLSNAVSLGSIFKEYVPGVVGIQIGDMITTITWIVYAWGGIQLWQKVSSKSMD